MQDVLYNPKTKEVYTPNTGKSRNIDKSTDIDNKEYTVGKNAVEAATEKIAEKTLNGAQTQSLITVISQYKAGVLSLKQAVNIIAVSIGISQEKATELIGETITETQSGENLLKSGGDSGTIQERANPNHDPKTGRFSSGSSGGRRKKKTKYSPSPQRNKSGIQLAPKEYAQLCGTLNTQYPGLKAGDVRNISDGNYAFKVTADGYGGMRINKKTKI